MNISLWELNHIDQKLIKLAFMEDVGFAFDDVTTQFLFSGINHTVQANIISKHQTPIIICGLTLVKTIIQKSDIECHLTAFHRDGSYLHPGEKLLTLEGPANYLLMIERIILNFLQRLSAIATHTRLFVEAIKHTKATILDTRKTLPGFRHLEKYAVCCGGGVNHRMGLYDAIMVKDTHIDFLGGIQSALMKLPDNILRKYPVIIEVRNEMELDIVLATATHKISRILLDNMSIELMNYCVAKCRGIVATEASGNIHLNNVARVAECGVNFISVGQITHSAPNVDLSLKCEIR